jgi:hypothetical protein
VLGRDCRAAEHRTHDYDVVHLRVIVGGSYVAAGGGRGTLLQQGSVRNVYHPTINAVYPQALEFLKPPTELRMPHMLLRRGLSESHLL